MENITVNNDEYNPVTIQDDIIKVDFVNLGEGLHGDYNPEDPEDINLLRFDVYVNDPGTDSWTEVEDASYCTQIPADTPIDTLKEKIKAIFDRYRDAISSYDDYLYGASVKKLGEELSWIGA